MCTAVVKPIRDRKQFVPTIAAITKSMCFIYL